LLPLTAFAGIPPVLKTNFYIKKTLSEFTDDEITRNIPEKSNEIALQGCWYKKSRLKILLLRQLLLPVKF
jgi:hypothetical protein